MPCSARDAALLCGLGPVIVGAKDRRDDLARRLGVCQHGGDPTSITDNLGWEVNCSAAPAVAMIAGTPGTVSGNQAGQLSCPIAP